ncbi:MAG TPA: helix-turn-helix transcriptional regulator [Acidimicrobiales bacterium]|jgi:transcriptional regulator with XRE-family HTH domain|nr:helix-turn-helix transcriptional regulator [Acidimicrobiales bacterium]
MTYGQVLQRQELGAFLRSRRERITPQQIGLTSAGRRRTPGLRREELAQIAGVGVTWYTWLEQGRDINVSAQVMEAVGRALLLDPHERAHVMTLAGLDDHFIAQECQSLAPAVQVMLDQLAPFPASVSNPRFDLLAYNATYGRLFSDLRAAALEDRNVLWLGFTHPQWRSVLVDWEDNMRRMVAQFRLNMADHMGEPAWKDLVRRLSEASPEFVSMWERRDVSGVENRVKLLHHDAVGLLRLDHSSYWLGPHLGTRLVVFTPTDDEARERLEKLELLDF